MLFSRAGLPKLQMLITPAEYNYLSSFKNANGTELLKLVLKNLWWKEVIEVEPRWVVLHPKEPRKRKRYFFKKGKRFEDYSTRLKQENFLLDLFKQCEEFQFSKLRNYIKKKFEKKGLIAFKNDFIISDLKEKGLIWLFLFPTKKSRSIVLPIREKLELIEKHLEHDLSASVIAETIEFLDFHILNLDYEIIKKIVEKSENLKRIEHLKFLETINESFNHFESVFDAGLAFDADFAFDGGLEGFGGGDFGGGGAFGDW